MQANLCQSWRPDLGGEGQYVDSLKAELGKPYWGTVSGPCSLPLVSPICQNHLDILSSAASLIKQYMHEEQIASMVAEMGPTGSGSGPPETTRSGSGHTFDGLMEAYDLQ